MINSLNYKHKMNPQNSTKKKETKFENSIAERTELRK